MVPLTLAILKDKALQIITEPSYAQKPHTVSSIHILISDLSRLASVVVVNILLSRVHCYSHRFNQMKNILSFVSLFRHPRHKKYIKEICEEMREARKEKLRPVLILYSLMDNQYMALL